MAVGYTNASWTLKCRPDLRVRVPAAQPHATTRTRQCTAVSQDASVSSEPLLGLSAGYIQRAADRFPRQGSRVPWRVHQSYLRDYRALRMSDVDDDAMTFSNPIDARRRPPKPNSSARGSQHERSRRPGRRHHRSRVGHRPGARIDLARRGCHLALADIDEAGLAETVAGCEGPASRSPPRYSTWPIARQSPPGPTRWSTSHGKVNLVVQQRRRRAWAPPSSRCPMRTSSG